MKKKKVVEYNLLSPDGITMFVDETFPTLEALEIGFNRWAERFKTQGYYSSCSGRIPLTELREHMTLSKITLTK